MRLLGKFYGSRNYSYFAVFWWLKSCIFEIPVETDEDRN